MRCWKSVGMPDFLQLDNELSFRGSNRKLNIFGETFKVSKDLVYSYVEAVIATKIHALNIYLGDELVDTFQYPIPA